MIDVEYVLRIVRQATAHNSGETVVDYRPLGSMLTLRMSSFPRRNEAIEALTNSGFGTYPWDDDVTFSVTETQVQGSTGGERIAAERARQISDEGYEPAKDKGRAAELIAAASEYSNLASLQVVAEPELLGDITTVPWGWPWQAGTWKPSTDPIRNAEKAGALLAAGIDALLLEQPTEGNEGNGTND